MIGKSDYLVNFEKNLLINCFNLMGMPIFTWEKRNNDFVF